MVSDVYIFDLETFKWDKLDQSTDEEVPQARYFHSADSCNSHLRSQSSVETDACFRV